jgi:hypothetical protein
MGDERALSRVIDLLEWQNGSRILCPWDTFGGSFSGKMTKQKMKTFGKLKVVRKTNKAFWENR